jgi:hypothetical protein
MEKKEEEEEEEEEEEKSHTLSHFFSQSKNINRSKKNESTLFEKKSREKRSNDMY